MTEILVATHNGGKVKELSLLLHLGDVKLLTMEDVHLDGLIVDEVDDTYEGNAGLKAKTLGDKTRHFTIADDSGLEVEALGGMPGVRSARFSKGSDSDRTRKLLNEMKEKQNRKAKFVCVIVFYDPQNNEKHVFRGEVSGVLAREIKGQNGFGYDPIFIPEGYRETFAQLPGNIKNEISHRAKAVAAFREWWLTRA